MSGPQQYNNPAARQFAQGIEGGGIGMDRGNLARAVLAVMKAVAYVEKRGRNDFHAYNYATESDVVAAIRRAMIDNDLVMLPRAHFTMQGQSPAIIDEHGITHIQIEYTLIHAVSGESAIISFPGSGSDKNRSGVGDKGVYKALTGGHKYALLKTFMVETGDDPERAEELNDPGKGAEPPDPRDDEWTEHNEDGTERDPENDDRNRETDPRTIGEREPRTNVEREREISEDKVARAADPLLRYTRDEIKTVVASVNGGKSPVMREPEMGDERDHPWQIVEEIFREFVPLHDTYESLKGFYEQNLPVLQIMDRESRKRKKMVDSYFTTQKKSLQYKDKDTRDMRKDSN